MAGGGGGGCVFWNLVSVYKLALVNIKQNDRMYQEDVGDIRVSAELVAVFHAWVY